MIYIFYTLAALLVYMSFKSLQGGIAYFRYFKKELAKPQTLYSPFVTVIAPCKGLEEGLEENLLALLEQDYPNYEIIFVVDSESDPAYLVLEAVCRQDAASERSTSIVVAQRSTDSSQKVENLRQAVQHADDKSKMFVFVDSDTRPTQQWLRQLVGPLENETIGAATGYRWFISERPTFGSELRSVWNASIASALGANQKSNFCWGGSTAIRREIFERLDMRERWRGTLSDDFVVTRVLKEAGLLIHFVPQALTASIGNCSLAETIEFTNRQMKITRVYSHDLWLRSFFGSIVFCAVMFSAFLTLVLSRQNDLAVVVAAATVAAVTVFSIGKSWLRHNAVEMVLADTRPAIKKQRLTQNTLWIITPALFLINCIAAAVSRTIVWRGIEYELISATETVIMTDKRSI
jgi:cellulose synthase/poly-beta-1,6-N-acetylglucosamine synthase-like glycosyltransferase